MFEVDNLNNTLRALRLDPDPELFLALSDAHAEPDRHYHDATHVAECLVNFQAYRHHAQRPHEVEIAFWFHDAVYDSRAPDNEERSAQWAEDYLISAGATPGSIVRVVDMILATKTHQVTSADSKLMLDIDLGILGTQAHVFERYDGAIRKEYHWVAEADYRTGRAQVLRTFLEREIIYHTPDIRARLELSARDNLARKIAELES